MADKPFQIGIFDYLSPIFIFVYLQSLFLLIPNLYFVSTGSALSIEDRLPTGCLKLSFTKSGICISCFQLGRYADYICGKSANAQFSKARFLDNLHYDD